MDKRLIQFWKGVALLCALVFFLIHPGVVAQDAGAFPFLELGVEVYPQRGLDEIGELPYRTDACPVCGFMVDIPLVDTLVRGASGEGKQKKWYMDASYRDTDFCPYPSKNTVFWQADVVICPNCGYAAETDIFSQAVSPKAKEWVLANLQPELREAQAGLLGWRRGEMSEGEVAVFFNRQSEIPDAIRLEHWLTCLDGMHAPTLERAKGCWRSAWAFRRCLTDDPKSEIFVRHIVDVRNELAVAKRPLPGLRGDIEALRSLLRKKRQSQDKNSLPGAFDMTGRLLLAGLWDRHGFLDEAEDVLQSLYNECRERYLRPEQDPLWVETSPRASRTHRLNELELMRTDAEREVSMHLELVRGERSRLRAASDLIRQAIGDGDLDGEPAKAKVYCYLIGEFLRRAGDLPLSSEWLKNLLGLENENSSLRTLAAEQLLLIREEAGDRVNLLSALGRDGELFAKLREICMGQAEIPRPK